MSDEKLKVQTEGEYDRPTAKATTGLDRGVQSLVAEDNPDDSQLGAEPHQGKRP